MQDSFILEKPNKITGYNQKGFFLNNL